jgi:hypothetical protein
MVRALRERALRLQPDNAEATTGMEKLDDD